MIYLGHIAVTCSPIGAVRRRGRAGQTVYYTYETSPTAYRDTEDLRRFIRQRRKGSPWLDMEIVEYPTAGWSSRTTPVTVRLSE